MQSIKTIDEISYPKELYKIKNYSMYKELGADGRQTAIEFINNSRQKIGLKRIDLNTAGNSELKSLLEYWQEINSARA